VIPLVACLDDLCRKTLLVDREKLVAVTARRSPGFCGLGALEQLIVYLLAPA
jgi:hypothetical protein